MRHLMTGTRSEGCVTGAVSSGERHCHATRHAAQPPPTPTHTWQEGGACEDPPCRRLAAQPPWVRLPCTPGILCGWPPSHLLRCLIGTDRPSLCFPAVKSPGMKSRLDLPGLEFIVGQMLEPQLLDSPKFSGHWSHSAPWWPGWGTPHLAGKEGDCPQGQTSAPHHFWPS